MHLTRATMLDGQVHEGPLYEFRPKKGWFSLVLDPLHYGGKEPPYRLWFHQCAALTTFGERVAVGVVADVDELQRAREEGYTTEAALESAALRIDHLEQCMRAAGLAAFMRNARPDEISRHLRSVIASYDEAANRAEAALLVAGKLLDATGPHDTAALLSESGASPEEYAEMISLLAKLRTKSG